MLVRQETSVPFLIELFINSEAEKDNKYYQECRWKGFSPTEIVLFENVHRNHVLLMFQFSQDFL